MVRIATRDFLPLFNDFARAKQNGVSPTNEQILQRYASCSALFLCYLDDRPVCGHMNLVDSDLRRSRLVYSASRRFDDPETARICAIINCYLHWHEMLAYREEDLKVYDFGGYSKGANAGIDRFKESFGGTVMDEHTCLCAGSPFLARLLLRLRPMIASPGVAPPSESATAKKSCAAFQAIENSRRQPLDAAGSWNSADGAEFR